MNLTSAVVACLLLSAAPPERVPVARPECLVVSVSRAIWSEPPAGPEALLIGRLEECVRGEDWPGAFRVAEELTPLIPLYRPDYLEDQPREWRASIAHLQLYGLQTREGEKALRAVLDEIPVRGPNDQEPPRSLGRQRAAYGMARAKAEVGDFPAALAWLKQAPDEYWTGCGNCREAREIQAHPIRTVWDKARLPYQEAVPALVAILAGDYTPMPVRLCPAKAAADAQKRHALAEAALILGELHLRKGNLELARASFVRAAGTTEYDTAFIARSRLRAIGR